MYKKLAWAVSIILEPFALVSLAWLFSILSLEEPLRNKLLWLFTFLVVSGLPPVLILIYERRVGKISNWFMTNRVERKDVEIAWLLGSLVLFSLLFLSNAPRLLLALGLATLLISFALATINTFWKVSFHMVGITFLTLVMVLVYSPVFLWLAIFLPLLAWARVLLGHHTLTQVTVGTLLTVVITLGSFAVFNLFTL